MEEKQVIFTESCPRCGRWLVTVYDNGSFDLAGRAKLHVLHSFFGGMPEEFHSECMKITCWLSRKDRDSFKFAGITALGGLACLFMFYAVWWQPDLFLPSFLLSWACILWMQSILRRSRRKP